MEKMFDNFTYTIIAINQLDIQPLSNIKSNRIAMFANNTNIYGNLNSSGLGCPAGQGLGAGIPSDDNCTASGGAHGGYPG